MSRKIGIEFKKLLTDEVIRRSFLSKLRKSSRYSALTMETASFLAVILSVVEGQPKRYSVQRVKTPKSLEWTSYEISKGKRVERFRKYWARKSAVEITDF